ncbi:MAG: hypothetical protein OMM_09742 [Candidatus Magnetoglobus multicellularis str. Araruama]|uniref:DUF4139 domain-containing protein n=1 Tax=Candidatus Magnetoglobus multicellularis str. Araruama TaxID=890399 RepID=A0A1V1P3A3_9BACT|nr:MAG: hypothetical protein OMM_09742 [Candidatus Magnetoglobus multicellularis str. Araruama]
MIAGICIFILPNTVVSRIKFVALPERGAIVIRLDHVDGAFIEEERTLHLEKGTNTVDFAWKDVRIDPDSIQLLILTHPDTVQLMHVSYPSDENALVWKIYSPKTQDEQVRVCYLLQGLDHLIQYRVFVNKNETRARLQMSLIVRNFSGEKFPFANVWLGYGKMLPVQLDHGETQKILLKNIENIVMEKRWEWDAHKESWRNHHPQKTGIPVFYTMDNVSKNGLGDYVLSAGKIRVFQDGQDGEPIFLGEDKTDPVPVGETMKICIARSFDLSVDQRVMEKRKINIRNNRKNRIVLYDTEEYILAKLKNYKTAPASLSVIQHIEGQWEMIECNIPFTLESASKLVFDVSLAPLEKKELAFRFNRRNIRP